MHLAEKVKDWKSLARDFAEMTDVYAETAAQRRLMEDKFSPTKISQQRLRAQTGEAALMQAIANQASAGAQIGGLALVEDLVVAELIRKISCTKIKLRL